MLQSVEIVGTGPMPRVPLDFASRLNVLAGDNGLGKTFLLDVIWWGLASSWPGYPATPHPEASAPLLKYTFQHTAFESRFDFSEQSWNVLLPAGAPPDWRRTLAVYARADGGFSVFDPLRTAGKHRLRFDQDAWGLSSSFHFSADDVWDGLSVNDHDGTVLCNGLIRDVTTWQLQNNEAFAAYAQALERLSPGAGETIRPGQAPVRVSVHDVRDIPTIELGYGTVPIVLASAGIRRITSLAYLLVWTWREHMEAARLKHRAPLRTLTLIIDEAEAHLHPRWQRVIMPSLLAVTDSLRASLDVQLFASTHAPLVLASLEPHFDTSRDALFTFDLVHNTVVAERAQWRVRGDASSWLTSDVFDLAQARSVEAEAAIERARHALANQSLPIEEVRRIHHDLRSVLKDTDPFWPRWLVRAHAAGILP